MAIDLKERVRDVPDWPEPGVTFRDITPLLRDAGALDHTVHELAEWGKAVRPDLVVGAEARGFILGAAIAREIGCGFVPARRRAWAGPFWRPRPRRGASGGRFWLIRAARRSRRVSSCGAAEAGASAPRIREAPA